MINKQLGNDNHTGIDYPDMPHFFRRLGQSIGNSDSDVVLLSCPGGPEFALNYTEFKRSYEDTYNIDTSKIFIINVHQYQTLYPEIFVDADHLYSFDECKTYATHNALYLNQLIHFFKSEGKTVYVVGCSYGGFIVSDAIAQGGNIADGYILTSTRIDMTPELWEIFADGQFTLFEDDATSVIPPHDMYYPLPEHMVDSMAKMAAGLGHKRYSELLQNTDLSNVIYLTGTQDKAVGKLTDDEIAFLKSKGAKVIIKETDHCVHKQYLGNILKSNIK